MQLELQTLVMRQQNDHSNVRKLHDTIVVAAPLANVQRAVVSSRMDAQRVISCLDDHGCRDVTHEVDFSTITDFVIQRGGFGQVYQARMRDGTKVAVKALIQVFNDLGGTYSKTKKRAGREGYNWSKFKHPNILQLLGVARYNSQVVLVSPWMERGTLSEYVSRYPEANRCGLAYQVAEGLVYMHSTGAVHGDVKGANVLVSDSGTAMLADFGNTVLEAYSLQFTPTGATECSVRWAAPELFDGVILHSMEGDVWALGMTVLETVTGKLPYDEIKYSGAVIRRIISKQLPERPSVQLLPSSPFGDRLWTLLTSCWAFEPSLRPTAAYMKDCLKDIVTTEECISGPESSN
ncbi:hypothetical protein FRC12_000787 [Ceratobasidium sp. 428]|nr:hypothetical protein FRC12_000787 [Ceratobasidium sp. 428]